MSLRRHPGGPEGEPGPIPELSRLSLWRQRRGDGTDPGQPPLRSGFRDDGLGVGLLGPHLSAYRRPSAVERRLSSSTASSRITPRTMYW